VSGSKKRTQNVAEATDRPAASRRETEGPEGGPPEAAHEIETEFPKMPHEIESEIPAEDGEAAHETKSEFPEAPHEIESEIPAGDGEAAHETKTEIPEGPHEAGSEFRETAHEMRSESAGAAELTEAMAERAAEFLLEGLRRAAGAR